MTKRENNVPSYLLSIYNNRPSFFVFWGFFVEKYYNYLRLKQHMQLFASVASITLL